MSDPIKTALRMIPYGFYAVTSNNGAEVNIMVANWLSQVSFSPQMVALGLQKTAYSYELIKTGGVFAINLFNATDSEAIMAYTKSRAKNPDKAAEATYTLSPTVNCPIVAGAAAYLECRVTQFVDIGGDHDVVIAEVVGAGVNKEGDANETLSLTQLGWSYAG